MNIIHDIAYYLYNNQDSKYCNSPYIDYSYIPTTEIFGQDLIKLEEKVTINSNKKSMIEHTSSIFNQLEKYKDFMHCFILKQRGWEYAVAFQIVRIVETGVEVKQYNKVYGSYSYLDCKPEESDFFSFEEIKNFEKNIETDPSLTTFYSRYYDYARIFSGRGLYFKSIKKLEHNL